MKSLLPRRWRQEMEQPLTTFQREMNRLWENFFGTMELPWGIAGEWSPRIDVSETETAVIVKAEVPGLDKDDIEVSVCGDALTIRGEKKDERKESKGNYRLLERRYGTFQRTVSLPTGIDAEKVDAEFKNGVLSITLPKTEETRTKKIEIKKEGA
jgi:HSP20 family protein